MSLFLIPKFPIYLMSSLRKALSKLLNELINLVKGIYEATIESSVSSLELEYLELEVALLNITLGSLVGVIPMPTLLVLELIPYLKDEFKLLELRSFKGTDVLGDLMASLGGEW